MAKVSDFLLPKKVLEIACNELDCDFVDCPIEFRNDQGYWSFENGVIVGPSPDVEQQSLPKTLYAIIETYLRSLPQINGHSADDEQIKPILMYVFALANAYGSGGKESFGDRSETVVTRLNQYPVVWMLMKDVVCPRQNAELKNLRVLAGHSHAVDAAVLLRDGDFRNPVFDSSEMPALFVNLDVGKESIRSAFLFYRAIEAHFPDEDAETIIRDLFSDYFLKSTLFGFLRMTFLDDESVRAFFATLSLLSKIEDIGSVVAKRAGSMKVAQSFLDGPWWYMGLIEKMLDPARGPDWSVTTEWKTVTDDLWQRVEVERKKRGLAEVPFELLLRVSSEYMKSDPKKTLQGLLGDARVW